MKKIFKFINENGIVSSLLASIIFALIIFVVSRDKSVLTYEIATNQKLFESENNEALIILRKDSQEVKRDIYYIEIEIWNQGNKPIEEQNIKESISFDFGKDIEILNGIKLEETHPNVTKSTIKIDSSRQKIITKFKYLEKGNGIKLKSYYTSSLEKESEIIHKGYISEGGEIKCFNETFSQAYSTWISIIFFFISIGFAWFASHYVFKYLDIGIGKFIDKEKHKYWNLAAYIIISIPILYFVLFKFLNKVPRWIKEFLENYFNPESPFIN